MEKEGSFVRAVAKDVRILAGVSAAAAVALTSGMLGLYLVLTLIFDRTTVTADNLPSVFSALANENTTDIPIARVFASYIPSFVGVCLSVAFFLLLRKTAKQFEKYNGAPAPGTHRSLLRLAVLAFAVNAAQYFVYFALRAALHADGLPKNFNNLYIIFSAVFLILTFVCRKKEKSTESLETFRQENSKINQENGDFSPEKENES